MSQNVCRLTIAKVISKLQTIDLDAMPAPSKNKGLRGQIIEQALGIPNSSALKDLEDGELKTFTIGESIACTQLNHCLAEIEQGVAFTYSKVGIKMANTLYAGFSRDEKFVGWTNIDCKVDISHFQKMEEDYNFITSKIREAMKNHTELGTINGPNKLLQIRTKASKVKGVYPPMMYKGHQLKNKYMAFYLTGQFGKQLLKKLN